jgi:hypothetical protein
MARLSQQLIILLVILVATMQEQPSNRAVEYFGQNHIRQVVIEDIKKIDEANTLSQVDMGKLKDYMSKPGEKSIDITGISFITMMMTLDGAQAVCRDGQISYDAGLNTGLLSYSANIKLTTYKDDKVNEVFEKLITFEIQMDNLRFIKEYTYNEEKKKVVRKLDFDCSFSLQDIVINDDKYDDHLDFIQEAFGTLIIEKVFFNIEAQIRGDFNKYYKDLNDADVEILVPMKTNTHPAHLYNLNSKWVSSGKAIGEKLECGLAFKTAANYEGLTQEDFHVDFDVFDTKWNNAIYLHFNVITELAKDALKEYKLHDLVGKSSNEAGLPFAFAMVYLDKLLPGITKQYSLSDKVEVEWTLYEPELEINLENGGIDGTARLDATVYKNNVPVRQLMSFDCAVNFGLEIEMGENGINFVFKHMRVNEDTLNVRNPSEGVRYDLFSEWLLKFINVKIVEKNTALFADPVKFGDFDSVKYFKDGFILHK